MAALGATIGGCCLPDTRDYACIGTRPDGRTPICRERSQLLAVCGGDEENEGIAVPLEGVDGDCVADSTCPNEGFTDDCGGGVWAEPNGC